jgi:ATP-binding cassette subfamily C protein
VRRHPIVLAACILSLIVDALCGLLVPIGIGVAIDVIAGKRPVEALALAIGMLVVAAIVAGVTATTSASLTARVTEPAVAALRESALESVLGADAATVEGAGSGDVVTRLTADVERLSEAASGALAAFIAGALAIGATIVGLAALDWRFAVAGLLAVPIQLGTLRWYLRRSGPVYREGRVAESERTQLILDAVRDAAAIRALRLEVRSLDEVGEASRRAVGLEGAAVRLSTRFFGRLNLAEFIGLAAISIVGFALVGWGDATIGAATTAALFFVRLFDPINTVLGLFDTIQQAGASLTRLAGLVGESGARDTDARPAAGDPRRSPAMGARRDSRGTFDAGVSAGAAAGAGAGIGVGIRLRGLSVSLPGRGEVLHHLDLDVLPGERVAIVGASGAGKTTLVRTIAGLIAPRSGSVEFADESGHLVGDVDAILLEQHTHVFTGTLADDLRLVAPDADDAELLGATRAAGIRLGSGAFAEGLASAVGSGASLTPADAQHIALARLVLASPRLAILDEASADAGSAAARRLEAAMDRVLPGRTSIVVAHRLGQAAVADRVVVMDHGRIVACAPHERLLAEVLAYRRLWDAWRAVSPGSVVSGLRGAEPATR